MKQLILLLLGLFLLETISAQENYVDGYYITLQGDTVKAKINTYINLYPHQIKVMLPNGETKRLQAPEIKGFSKLGVYQYRTINDGGVRQFARLLEQGEINLWISAYDPESNPDNGLLNYSDEQRTAVYLVRTQKNDSAINLAGFNFKKLVGPLLVNDPELLKLVENKEITGLSHLPALFHLYNEKRRGHYKPGMERSFVVTLSGDTVYGTISESKMEGVKDKFKPSDAKAAFTEEKLSPDNFKGYTRLHYYSFESIEVGKEGKKFLERLETGALSLYYRRTDSFEDQYAYRDKKFYFFYIKTKDGKSTGINSHNFEEVFPSLIADDAGLVEMIKKKELMYTDIRLIIKKYNQDKGGK